ncbi:MAG: S46 family peptidase, partial [Bryobacteraceae bacterium]
MKIPAVLLACALALPVLGDEGMWLFNEFPKDAVQKAYSFDATNAFLESLRLATLRIGGSSGSFVSAGGLVLTNREAVENCVAKLSTPEHDYVKDGFYAAAG